MLYSSVFILDLSAPQQSMSLVPRLFIIDWLNDKVNERVSEWVSQWDDDDDDDDDVDDDDEDDDDGDHDGSDGVVVVCMVAVGVVAVTLVASMTMTLR